MKPIPAIVEKAIDIDKIGREIRAALSGEQMAQLEVKTLTGKLETATGAARARRLEVGRLLTEARQAFPARGPAAKGWGDYLTSVGLAERTARHYMEEWRDPVGFGQSGPKPHPVPVSDDEDDEDGQTGPRIVPAGRETAPPFRQLAESDLVQALARLDPEARKRVLRDTATNPHGGTGEVERGTWTTSAKWAAAVGSFDLDPFSNPRSKIASVTRCMLEDGGDGFGGVQPGSTHGLYLVGTGALRSGAAPSFAAQPLSGMADADTRVWIQPPYEIVLDAIAHYGHTRFVALLRFSPDVEWFRRLWPLTCAVAIPLERMDFDPPPGVEKPKSSIPYPHALYYADERDITSEVRALCQIWRVDHEARPPMRLAVEA